MSQDDPAKDEPPEEPDQGAPFVPVVDDEDDDPPSVPVTISFDARYLRRTLFIIFAAIIMLLTVLWAWNLLGRFAFNLLLAWLLAISVEPIVSWLANKGLRRGLATAIVAVGGLLVFGGFIAVFGGALAQQVAELVTALPDLILDIVDWINETFNTKLDPNDLLTDLNLTPQMIGEIAGNLAGGILGVFLGIVSVVFDFVTILVFAFYFSADAPRIKRFVASWLRPKHQVAFIRVWDISVTKAGGFVISKVALATLSAAAHVGFFYLIDVPYWLPMGIFAGIVSQFIPTIGTYLGVALPALFAAFDDPLDIVWIILFATVYQQVENYVFTPRISRRTMNVNSGVALAAVFIGAALFGPIGAIIGIPLVAIVVAVVEAYGQRYAVHPEVERSAGQSP